MNVLERRHVGLVFFVPGLTETLRVNGRAEISTDPEHLEVLAINWVYRRKLNAGFGGS